jgi:hypothetical protein
MKEDKLDGTCGRYGEKKNVHTDSVVKPEVKTRYRRSRSRQEDYIKVDFIEIG